MSLRTLFCVISLFLISQFCNAQQFKDLVVTQSGDSIRCFISKVKYNYVYFEFMRGYEVNDSSLATDSIKDYLFDYYKNISPDGSTVPTRAYPPLRIAVNGGYSYQLANTQSVPDGLENYTKELKSGYHLGGDFTYFFEENYGIGFQYYLFRTTNSLDNIYIEFDDGSRRFGNLKDNISISFLGPQFSVRYLNLTSFNAFIMNFSLGYLMYNNNAVIIDNYTFKGDALGLAWDIGYDISVAENFQLGLQIGLILGSLSELDVNDGRTSTTLSLSNAERQSLCRLDFSIGLRIIP